MLDITVNKNYFISRVVKDLNMPQLQEDFLRAIESHVKKTKEWSDLERKALAKLLAQSRKNLETTDEKVNGHRVAEVIELSYKSIFTILTTQRFVTETYPCEYEAFFHAGLIGQRNPELKKHLRTLMPTVCEGLQKFLTDDRFKPDDTHPRRKSVVARRAATAFGITIRTSSTTKIKVNS